MEFGVAIFPTHDAIRPGDVARLAEERGHESLFFPEHTHMPVEHSPYPGGEPLPYRYSHTFDLFVALTAAATIFSPAVGLAWLGSEPMRPSGKRRR